LVDIAGSPGTPTADDFIFKTGNDSYPTNWSPLTTPPAITVRDGEGDNDPDRLIITWPNNTIQNTWLQVTMLANENTGLPDADVFYFGNLVGECTGDGKVDAYDVLQVRSNPRPFFNPARIDTLHDFNRDERVDSIDTLVARNNQTWSMTELELIDLSGSKVAAVAKASAGFVSLKKAPAQDAVFREADDEGLNDQQTLPSKLAWLYEFEQMDHQRPASRNGAAEQALDRLLAQYGR